MRLECSSSQTGGCFLTDRHSYTGLVASEAPTADIVVVINIVPHIIASYSSFHAIYQLPLSTSVVFEIQVADVSTICLTM